MSETAPIVHVVDDDTSFLTAISRLLRANGFSVKTYSSAHEFLAQRDTQSPGCVLADLRMPEMNGLDLQSALAQSPNPLPIVFFNRAGRYFLDRASYARWCGGFPGKAGSKRNVVGRGDPRL